MSVLLKSNVPIDENCEIWELNVLSANSLTQIDFGIVHMYLRLIA